MTTYFVTRHPGARAWALRQGIEAQALTHLDPEQVVAGDTVIGTLPVHLAAEVCSAGARYLHLSMTLPIEARGKDLSADDMDRFGAVLQPYDIRRLDP